MVILVGKLADAALELEIFDGAQDGSFLLFLRARRAECESIFDRQLRLSKGVSQARPKKRDCGDERSGGKRQDGECRPVPQPSYGCGQQHDPRQCARAVAPEEIIESGGRQLARRRGFFRLVAQCLVAQSRSSSSSSSRSS